MIVAGILSSLVSVTSVAAQTGYQQSTGQITQAFTMAFSWLPAVLKIKSVVFGVLLILFWIFLYNIILVGVRRWLVREGETTKMHKAIAGSLAGIMILSVFFLTKDPMGKAQQIAGSFGMFFAIIISAVVYFLSKSMIRNNTDGESGGFQSTMLGALCLLLFTYLAEGTAWGGIRYLLMGVAFLILFIGMIMKVGSVSRGWGCSNGYDPFGDRTDQLPRSPGSVGDAATRFLGSSIDVGGRLWRWYRQRGLRPEQIEYHDRLEAFENNFRSEFEDFDKIFQLYTEKSREIPRMRTLYHTKWKKCRKFLEKTFPNILTRERSYITRFLDDCAAGTHNASSLLRAMQRAEPAGGLTPAQMTNIMTRFAAHQAAIETALGALRGSVDTQIGILNTIRNNPMQTPTHLGNILTNHLNSPAGTEFMALSSLRTALDALRTDIETILGGPAPGGPGPGGPAPGTPAAEVAAHIDDVAPVRFEYVGIVTFETLRDFFDFFRDPGRNNITKRGMASARRDELSDWVESIGCLLLARELVTKGPADFVNYVNSIPIPP